MLLRTYYYDCRPNGDTKTDPNGKRIDFSKHPQFKAARREGILVYLHPMGQPQIKITLKEHADFIIE
jgi:hypothetical protein